MKRGGIGRIEDAAPVEVHEREEWVCVCVDGAFPSMLYGVLYDEEYRTVRVMEIHRKRLETIREKALHPSTITSGAYIDTLRLNHSTPLKHFRIHLVPVCYTSFCQFTVFHTI